MKRAELEKYRKALDEAVQLAQDDLKKAFDLLVGSGIPAEQVRDGLVEATFGIASIYGDVAATASAEWYEARRPSRLGEYQAVLGETVSYGEVEGSVRYAAGHLFDGDPQQTLTVLNGSLQRFVESPARDTIHKNALRDPSKPRWARVPSGGKTCAWCFMLCSRGFVYKTEVSAGGVGNKFHDDDRCMIVPGWGTNPTIEGYDPEAMYDLYQKVWSPGDTDRDVARKLRAAYPDMFSDGGNRRSGLDRSLFGPRGISESMKEAARNANPRFGQGREYQENCPFCVSAYELRRRGYDVIAQAGNGKRMSEIAEAWGASLSDWQNTPTITSLRKAVTSSEDGARFILAVTWKGRGAGGHVMIAENVNGKMRLIDPQNPSHALKWDRISKGKAWVLQVDNRTPAESILKSWVEGGKQ